MNKRYSKVDPLDIKILELLMENARMECNAIAALVGVSDRTVARRIRRMEEEGIIKGYSVKLDRELIRKGFLRVKPAFALIADESIETDAPEWDSLVKSTREMFGSGSVVILFQMGVGIGESYVEKLKNLKLDKQEMLLLFSQIFSTRGWGVISLNDINFEACTGKMTVTDMPFKDHLTTHILRGIINSFLEYVFGEKLIINDLSSESERNQGILKIAFQAAKEKPA